MALFKRQKAHIDFAELRIDLGAEGLYFAAHLHAFAAHFIAQRGEGTIDHAPQRQGDGG